MDVSSQTGQEISQVVIQGSGNSQMIPLIVVSVIFAVLIFGGLILGLFLMRKQKKTQEGSTSGAVGSSSAPSLNGAMILDTKRLVEKVEKVEDGIIVTDNGQRFVAAITCRGIDFYNEGLSEQISVMRGYQNFLNIIEKPMTYRIYGKAVDLDSSKERYKAKLEETLDEYEQHLRALQLAKEKQAEEIEIRKLEEVLEYCEHRIKHLNEQLDCMEFYSGSAVRDVTQDYIFDWTYTGDEKLGPDEIFLKARRELTAIAIQKIDALLAAGVKGRMCTNDEMIDMLRRHSKPVTAESYKQKMVASSSFEEDVVGSESMDIAENLLRIKDMETLGQQLEESISEDFFFNEGDDYDEED